MLGTVPSIARLPSTAWLECILDIRITRHYATVCTNLPGLPSQRQVHYRRAGAGPPVVLLHQSPLSSVEMLPLLQQLATTHTVIAPDMPGYGASEPFGEAEVTMALLADNLALLLDSLQISATAIYGFHTGASLATAFAQRHPQRVVVVIADGLLCLESDEREEFLKHYLQPFIPSWDGAHLAWLWTRLKDQSIFFPWYQRTVQARLAMDAASPPQLDIRIRDWLRSGDGYRRGYAAAISYDPRHDLPGIATPHYIVSNRNDPLLTHLQRLPTLPENIHIHTYASGSETQLAVGKILQRYRHRAVAVATPVQPPTERVWFDYVTVQGQQLRILRAGQSTASVPITVIQHDAHSSLQACREFVDGLAAYRSVVMLEMPGHGETDAQPAELMSIESLVQLGNDALDSLDITSCDLIGIGAGAALQTEMTRLQPNRVCSLTAINAVDVTADQALQQALLNSYREFECDSYGGYLLRAWHQARDHSLFFPWYERRREFAVQGQPLLDPQQLQQRAIDLLLAGQCGNALRKAELSYPLSARLDSLPITARLAASHSEPRFVHTQSLAKTNRQFLTLPVASAQWGEALFARS